MPTRVVGTCCCGTPNFIVNFQVWVQLELGFEHVMQNNDPDDKILQCTSFTPAFLPNVPAKWKIEYYYPETGGTYVGGYPMGSGWTDGSSGMNEYDRTSLVSIGYGSKVGGSGHNSMDATDWVALSNVSSFGFDITTSPIGMPAYDDSIENYCKTLVPTNDWTFDFTYQGSSYRLTVPHEGNHVCGRNRLYQKHFTEVDDEMSNGIWYARYTFDWTGHVTRVSSGN